MLNLGKGKLLEQKKNVFWKQRAVRGTKGGHIAWWHDVIEATEAKARQSQKVNWFITPKSWEWHEREGLREKEKKRERNGARRKCMVLLSCLALLWLSYLAKLSKKKIHSRYYFHDGEKDCLKLKKKEFQVISSTFNKYLAQTITIKHFLFPLVDSMLWMIRSTRLENNCQYIFHFY